MSDTDFAGLTEGLCIRFWGKPTSKTAKELLWGSGGSRKFNLSEMVWYDHEAGEGGGAIALVMRECSTDRQGALEWMRKEGLIQDRHVASAAQQREEAPPTDNEQPEQESLPVDAPQAKEKAIKGYRYTDGDGNTLYEVIRYHFQFPDGTWQMGKNGNARKTFKQRRPDGRGGYIWGLGDVGHTIFRRQEVEIAIAEGRTIYMPEGEKDVETIEAWDLVSTTNSGGAGNWKPEFAEFFRGADVVILGDDDEPGRERVETIARSLRGIAGRIRTITEWSGHKDVTDWRDKGGGTAEALENITRNIPDWRPRPPRSLFNALAVKDAIKFAADHEWLVEDLIELHGTASFSGNSQSGKTFQVIELAFCVATGRPYWGRAVKQGLVVYQVGEGEEGFMKRLAGYFKDRGIDDMSDLPIVILPKKINLFHADDDANNLIKESKAWEEYYGIPLRLVVIDTFNKATRGANEISGQDIGKINERLERIQAECRCCVTVVDHLSKGGTVRGHGSKTGDITNMILVEKDERKVDNNGRSIRRMKLDKNKDGENGGVIQFVLRQVVVGFKDDGKAITTCVVEPPDGNDEEIERSGRLSLPRAFLLNTIRDVVAREGFEAPAEVKDVPKGRHVAPWKSVMNELRRKWQFKAPENEPEKREIELQRIVADAGRALQTLGYIDRDNTAGVVWWTGKTDRPLFKPKPVEQPGAGIAPDVKQEISSMDVPF